MRVRKTTIHSAIAYLERILVVSGRITYTNVVRSIPYAFVRLVHSHLKIAFNFSLWAASWLQPSIMARNARYRLCRNFGNSEIVVILSMNSIPWNCQLLPSEISAHFIEFRCILYFHDRLDWCLTALGPIHFVHYFVSRPVIFANDTIQDQNVVSEAFEYYRKYTEFFIDLCLQGTFCWISKRREE